MTSILLLKGIPFRINRLRAAYWAHVKGHFSYSSTAACPWRENRSFSWWRPSSLLLAWICHRSCFKSIDALRTSASIELVTQWRFDIILSDYHQKFGFCSVLACVWIEWQLLVNFFYDISFRNVRDLGACEVNGTIFVTACLQWTLRLLSQFQPPEHELEVRFEKFLLICETFKWMMKQE